MEIFFMLSIKIQGLTTERHLHNYTSNLKQMLEFWSLCPCKVAIRTLLASLGNGQVTTVLAVGASFNAFHGHGVFGSGQCFELSVLEYVNFN